MAKLQAYASQLSLPDYSSDYGDVRMTDQGAPYTADWIEQAIRAGYGWSIHVGTIVSGFAQSMITGGGSGTCIDQDQPEIAIGIDSGWLVPTRISVSAHTDIDAADDDAWIIAIADTEANGVSTAPTGTAETPTNLLDGAGSCSANCYSAITADITDPTVSQILDVENIVGNAASGGLEMEYLKMDYPKQPWQIRRLKGACSIYVYWGGVAATYAMATVEFLVLPTNYFAIS